MFLNNRVVALLAVGLAACGTGIEGSYPQTTADTTGASTATSNPNPSANCGSDSWSTYAQAIFTSKCVPCHIKQATYAGVKADLSAIQSKIDNGSMPPNGSLDANDRTRLITWLACGAPQDPPSSGTTTGTTSTGGSGTATTTGGTTTTTTGGTTATTTGGTTATTTGGTTTTTTGGTTTTTTGGGTTTTGTTTGTSTCTPDTYSNYVQGLFASTCIGCHGGFSTYAGIRGSSANIQTELNLNAMPPGTPLDATDRNRVLTWILCGLPQ